ncbi:hypothetical protein [Endozoicomonas numazuensis]|uniref:Uncharacterized protein n=1 Tax=Endozoicomonas numazuensis TaxID=1137799 RepID=A0A081NL66_9GAMM|nr:hypothetical protein [Endozoicomonas numazuensis]KEQ19189.1 hypothetical protein GZ78_04125 [Endozoicomonas numazuensis]
MSLSKEQQKQVTDHLQSAVFGTVEFEYQEVKVSITRRFVSESESRLFVYFDGVYRPAWGIESMDSFNPLTKKLWHKRTKALYSPKKIANLRKKIGVRAMKKHLPDFDKKQVWYEPCFKNSTVLMRQYAKLEDLELVAVGGDLV